MEVRLIEAISLMNLAQTLQNKNLPIRTAFKMNKLLLAIEEHSNFYHQQIQKFIEEYSEKEEDGTPKFTENGQGFQIEKGYETECNLKLQELSDILVELPSDIKFTFDELDDVTISIQDMYLFSRFIEEE